MWELTMDPSTGRPMPERLEAIQAQLKQERLLNRAGGGDASYPWIDRGPNNVGGRTRGIMFDPNDTEYDRVFAGGVSGGLWVNEDITNPNSPWSLVPGIDANIRVTQIIHDPNDTDTFYIGSGESYVAGYAVGRGIWKSVDGGVTWTNIFGGADGTVTAEEIVNGIFYINDIVARDVGSTTELFISVAGVLYQDASPNQFNGLFEQGLYKSADNGASWSQIPLAPEANGTQPNPNDLEIDIDNNVWLTTTRSNFGFNGGKIFKSTDGTNFSLVTTIANAERTELEPSSLDSDKFWVAAEVNGEADLFITEDSFTSLSQINEPEDTDTDISSTDYTRGQAFYDLPIETDDNDHLYVGGIDLFKSENDGNSWSQISKWSNNNDLATLNVPLVHADHHSIVFRPGSNAAVFGTDGGVYYTPDVTAFATQIDIDNIEVGFNTTQFYYGDLGPDENNLILLGGTQDNGSIISQNSNDGANSFNDYFFFFSGDGAYCEIDDNGGLTGFGDGNYMIVSSIFNNYRIASPGVSSATEAFNNGYDMGSSSAGNFINEAELDQNQNILFTNSSVGNNNRISAFVLGASSATEQIYTNAQLNSEPSALKISPFTTNRSKLYAGLRNGKLLRVDNADIAPSYTDISGPDFVGSISDIEFGQNENEIFVTFHNYGVTSIWFTNDGGSIWSNIEGDLPDIPVKCILQNPLLPEEVIIGTELGVWRTSDFTANNVEWVQSYNGMSDVLVVDLDLRTSDNTILATTHGRGFFTSQFTSEALSVNNYNNIQDLFSISPTLSDGNFNLTGQNLGQTKLRIYNLSGKQVFYSEYNLIDNISVPIQLQVNPGIYLVQIVDEKERRATKKLLIQ